jgi:3'-5' exonuclease
MQHLAISDFVFIDIETASNAPSFEELDSNWQKLWEQKVIKYLPENTTVAEMYQQRAGVMAEFSRIVCISMGYFLHEENLKFRVKSFFNDDEKILLQDFLQTIQRIEKHNSNWHFAGHNIKEFDIPFICRRMVAKQIPLPKFMDFQNRKPWETNIVDTFQYWRFGDYKNYTSLNLLAAVMDVPTSKDDIDGSMVGSLYHEKNAELQKLNKRRIIEYCQKDVVATANIVLRFKNIPLLHPDDVEIIEEG